MRVTEGMMNYNYLSDLNKVMERRANAQSLLSGDGKALRKPSDDPVKVVRSLRFNISLELNEQYTQNVKDAQSWMRNTDGYMQQLSTILIHIRTKVIDASDISNSPTSMQAIGVEVDNMINEIVRNIGNAKIGDRYLFAGQMDKTEPFSREGDVITYHGDNEKISMPIAPGLANPNLDSVNLTGMDLFGLDQESGGLKILNDLIEIKNRIMSGTPADMAWLSDVGLNKLEDAHNHVLRGHTYLGARMTVYEMSETMLIESNAIIWEDRSHNEDANIAKAMLEFSTADTVYNASLLMGSKVLPQSLVNFL